MSPLLRRSLFCTAAFCAFIVTPTLAVEPTYNADVRPILADKCFRCHGPDAAARQGDLRLDVREEAIADRGGHQAIVPGRPEASEIYRRIVTEEAGEQMPPPDSGQSLSAEERETLRRWLAAGAKYEAHWSFIPPEAVELPQGPQGGETAHPIDRFIDAHLQEAGVKPNGAAAPEILCRRLHLDLTGLPPTIAEVEQFVVAYTARGADREAVFEALVDRLLASPRYGERMAAPWLDAARFADTNGYQTDGPRQMWRWRDWVIAAFNRNLPFDEFTVEQLAGDLLPTPTLDQQIATGFHRNHRMNAEGGIIAEEYLAEYVADRVETTGTVWLGLTVGCARCHDHKYDPISQREFYELFDFFNRVPEPGKAIRDDNSPPTIAAPTQEQQEQLVALRAKATGAEKAWTNAQAEVAAAERAWAGQATRDPSQWTITDGLTHRFLFDASLADEAAPETKATWSAKGSPSYAPGPFGFSLQLDGQGSLNAGHIPQFDSEKPFSSSVWLRPDEEDSGTIYAAMDADMSQNGIELRLTSGRPQIVLCARILDDVVRVETEQALPAGQWSHFAWTYDGSRSAKGVRAFIDGRPVKIKVVTDTLSNKFKVTESLTIGAAGTGGEFQGRIADLRYYERALAHHEAAIVYCGLSIRALAQAYGSYRDPAAAIKMREYFLRHAAPKELKAKREAVRLTKADVVELERQVPTTMVMLDEPGLRKTHVLLRGEYDKPGDVVAAGVPKAFGLPLPSDESHDRLALARWLVDRRHPLTARVAVNRLWQQFFGVGLVKTVEDFGLQGDWPVHKDLLDWLAVDFMDRGQGWDVKLLVKRIVTSAAYRRSSKLSPELLKADAENRLLARGPRFRLSAEAVRDSALFASGLLKERVGGPSVKPYQPAGLWEELGTGAVKYEQDHGDDLYRRSLYVYRKRTVSVPMLSLFDAAARETCVVRQTRTNTPLQSLNLLNDVAFVEAARALAARMLRDGGSDPAVQIEHGFRLVLARRPSAEELALLTAGHERRLTAFQSDHKAASALLAQGESPRDGSFDVAQWAAMTTTANVLLNLDEFVTRE
jgi:hypothetical protein